MKAVWLENYADPGELGVREVTNPAGMADGQIMVEVKAAAINPFDLDLISGKLKETSPLSFPFIPGGDFSGIVREKGSAVNDLNAGDQIFGTANLKSGGSGSFAQFLLVKDENVSFKPANLSFEEAAAAVLVGVSAVQALLEHIELQPEQKILIHGGAGGIGHVAIQLAKAIGAHVSTTVSAKDSEFVQSLGATGVIDYKTQEFDKLLKDCDAVYDTIGGEITFKSFSVLKKGGVLVSMKGQPDPELAKKYKVAVIKQNTRVTKDRLMRLSGFFENGKLTVHVDKIFPLESIKEAILYQQSPERKGKVVLRM